MKIYSALLRGVTKRYGATIALSGVNLKVPNCGVTGLIGPNGAGKTTLLEILLGRRRPNEGEVFTLGVDPARHPTKIKRNISMMFQSVSLPPYSTTRELITLFCTCHNVPQKTGDFIDSIGLGNSQDKQVQTLSGGQKQRLALVLCLIGNPDLMILDEPTSSLDPQARRIAWRLIREHVSKPGKSVIMSSHSMEEAQMVCDQIAVIDGGRIQAIDTSQALIDQYAPGYNIKFKTKQICVELLEKAGFSLFVSHEDGEDILIETKAENVHSIQTIVTSLESLLGNNISNLFIQPSTLDDVFLNITGHQIRD